MKKKFISALFFCTSSMLFGQRYVGIKECDMQRYLTVPDSVAILFVDSTTSKIILTHDSTRGYYAYRQQTNYYVSQGHLIKSEKTSYFDIGISDDESFGLSSITLTVFSCKKDTTEIIGHHSKYADEFNPCKDRDYDYYFSSKRNGCCAYLDHYELSTFPDNIPFLSYNQTLYKIISTDRYPNKKTVIYFGFDETQRYKNDKETMNLGTLNYSINQEVNGSVVFKREAGSCTNTNNKRCDIPIGLPEIKLITGRTTHTDTSYDLVKSVNSDELKCIRSYSEINKVGIMVSFYCYCSDGYQKKEYTLWFVNGEIPQKEIIVDFLK